MSFVFGLLNGSMRFLWGLLLDLLGFKILMLTICILELGVSISIYFIAEIQILYFIENMIIASCLSGGFTLLTPTFNKVFGTKLGSTMYGIGACFIGLASILGPVLTKFIIKNKEDYLIIYLCGSVFVIMSLITLIFFKEDPFDYRKPINSKIQKEGYQSPSIQQSQQIIPKDDDCVSDDINQYQLKQNLNNKEKDEEKATKEI